MAQRAKSGGVSTGVGVALVLLGLAFVTSTTLAIVFYVNIEDARSNEQAAQAELARAISETDRQHSDIRALWDRTRSDNTLTTQLRQEVRNLRTLIVGDDAMSHARIEEMLPEEMTFRRATDGVETHLAADGRSIIADFRSVVGQMGTMAQRVEEREGRVTSLTRELEEANRRIDATQTEHASAVRAIEQRLEEARQGYDRDREAWNQTRTRTQNELAQMRRTFQEFRAQIEQSDRAPDVSRLREELARAEHRIRELENQLESRRQAPAVATATRPDGRVVSVLREGDLVLVDMGRDDRVPLGLTFEIFEAALGDIPAGGDSKGAVEIIELRDRTSVARVVRTTPGERIGTGDLLMNQVFDRDRTYRFFVHGNFDLDNRGEATVADRRRLEALIENAGGRVATALDHQVDFVILGPRPDRPEPLEIGAREVDRQAFNVALERFEEFERIETRAMERNIPVLSQNRFLGMMGYYRR
ncbi:MAG: hypothetical protein JJU36_16620 [Phycisphaeraceae bacterium]|nr:hypothetical protein [Phycisphaeraceae bacterium]